MRKQEEDEDPASHDNRSLTPRMKQFKSDGPSETLLFGDEDEKPLGAGSLVRGKPTSRFFET
jgi:hypothetical protein